MQFYSLKIQLHMNVIKDIFAEIKPDTRMLVFGLGYDSKMWSTATKCFFIEDKQAFIEMNSELPNVVKYHYTDIRRTSSKSDEDLEAYTIPQIILDNGPYDIILVDGPEGHNDSKPGRMLPIYWCTKLSKPGTIVYVDDSSRKSETSCITRFLPKPTKIFQERNKCAKIIMVS